MNIKKHKYCWIAKQYKLGYRIGLCISEQETRYIPGIMFLTEKDVERVIHKGNIVFVHLKDNK